MKPLQQNAFANVLGVAVSAVDMDAALGEIEAILQNKQKAYICVVGVHGIMEAQRSAELLQAFHASDLCVPDGMPLVWTGWLQGHSEMARVTGPDLMLQMFAQPRFRSLRHFLYGGKPGVAEELKARLQTRFPGTNIMGTYTPPFRDLREDELEELSVQILAAKPDVVWIGIGCPRQELFMARHLPRLNTRLMIGVGAAFDFHTGRIRDCAPWIKRAGLQWLHRLLQDPRLWRRYARNNPAFVWRIVLQFLNERVTRRGRRFSPTSVHGAPQQDAPKRAKTATT